MFSTSECNALWHHPFLSGASMTSCTDSWPFCPSVTFCLLGSLHRSFMCSTCFPSFLLQCWIPVSSIKNKFPHPDIIHLAFFCSSGEASSPLSNASLCSFCYQFKLNITETKLYHLLNPLPNLLSLPLKTQQNTVLPVTHTQACGLIFDLASNSLHPSSISN